MFVYIGTYTQPQGDAEGIVVCRFDEASGALTPVQTVRDVANASWLAVRPGGGIVCAVRETDPGEVGAFARDAETGALTALNRQSSEGAGPCYVSFDPSGRFVLVANYGSGTLAALPIDETGRLQPASASFQQAGATGPNRARQDGPHAHMIAPSPDGNFILATDLGLDRVFVYRLDPTSGDLSQHEAGADASALPGAGPRHFAFAPDGRTAYVINELNSTLTAYDWDAANGTLNARQTVSSLPAGVDAADNTTAQVVVAPDGRFVYGSNRGHDSIAIWSVAAGSGDLALIGHAPTGGRTPRNFALDLSGQWLLAANQDSNTVVTFRRDAATGGLTATGDMVEIPSPVCIVFAE